MESALAKVSSGSMSVLESLFGAVLLIVFFATLEVLKLGFSETFGIEVSERI